MSTNITNLGRNGLYDWLVQRVTAIILGVYFLVVMGFLVCSSELTYESWSCFIGSAPMKVATILVLLSIAAHAWIGMWTISTDYLIKDGHLFGSVPTFLRVGFQSFCVLLLLACVLWGTLIIWGL